MAKITEITYSESKTWQEAQFEPRNIHISAKMELADDDKMAEEYAFLRNMVRRELAKSLPTPPQDITKSNNIPF